ncbi:MAG: MOSC domain-containing protein [Candidatus Cyclobacteriaceae bacterium M3_2C_046]
MTQSVVSAIYFYPLKSVAGLSLETAELDKNGIRHDRKWMLVDQNRNFISQRTLPKLALLGLKPEADHYQVFEKRDPQNAIQIPFNSSSEQSRIKVNLWDDWYEVALLDTRLDQWFSRFIGQECQIVCLPEDVDRWVDPRYAPGYTTALSDGFPFLLTSEASLQDLNNRLDLPVQMDRFRPNLVIKGSSAWEEDSWDEIMIGQARFRLARPCARCRITTIDQETAITGKEPLKTLSTFRKSGTKILFGQNMVCLEGNQVKVGDPVRIITKK